MTTTGLPALLQSFFTNRLLGQLGASPHTVACYRDAFRLLLRFAAEQLRRTPTALRVEDLNAPFLGQFLDHLEHSRGCSARTRNIRLSALHAFFRYVAFEEPGHALHCQRVLAIPHKRHERRPVEFLSCPIVAIHSAGRGLWEDRGERGLVVPWQPVCRVRPHPIDVALEHGEVLEGIDAFESACVDEAHEEIADPGAVKGLVEQRQHGGRTPLTAAISTDGDRTYPRKRNLISGPGSFAYPTAIQTRDGKIHVVFPTEERTVILHAVFEEPAI